MSTGNPAPSEAGDTRPNAAAPARQPVRGVLLIRCDWDRENGWRFTSQDEYGNWTASWTGRERKVPTAAYCSLKSLEEENPTFDEGRDGVVVAETPDHTGLEVIRVRTTAVALVTSTPDAQISTLDWHTFAASEVTLRNFARNRKRVATMPLRTLIEQNYVQPQRALFAKDNMALPIANLEEFDNPPIPRLAREWNVAMKSLRFVETTSEPTTQVTRVPSFIRAYAFTDFNDKSEFPPPFDPDYDDAYELRKEIILGLPEILNGTNDRKLVDWLIKEVLTPTLDRSADRGPRWGEITTRSYIGQRLGEIESPVWRSKVTKALRSRTLQGQSASPAGAVLE